MPTDTVSTRLKRALQPLLDRALKLQLVVEMTQRSADYGILARYFTLERDFVQKAAHARGAAILRCPSMQALRGHLEALNSLATHQDPLLSRLLSELPNPPLPSPEALRLSSSLGEFVGNVATAGTYPDLVAVLFAAETLYAYWCRRAGTHDAGGTDTASSIVTCWIEAHTSDEFLAQLGFLEYELDNFDPSSAHFSRLLNHCKLTLEHEFSFHEAPYARWESYL